MHVGLHSFSRREAFKSQGYDVFAFLDEASDWAFDSVEIMTGNAGKPPTDIGGDAPAHLKKVCRHAAERGLKVHCFSTYNDFAFVRDEAWRQDNLRYIQQWIRLAGEVGVPNLRFLSGYWAKDHPHDDLEKLVVEGTRTCCELAEREGVNLAFENHSTIFCYAADIERLLKAVDSPRLTTCPDPTNGFQIGEEGSEEQERMYANLERLAPRATNAHLKIFGVEHEGLAGFDLDRILRIFDQAGYDGPLHLELVQPDADPAVLTQACRIVKAAVLRVNQPRPSSARTV